jgi:hypothetical protein
MSSWGGLLRRVHARRRRLLWGGGDKYGGLASNWLSGGALGFYGGAYRGLYSTMQGWARRLAGGSGLDANGDAGRALGANLGENGAYGRRATSIECWAGSRRPGSSLSATKTWPASSSSVSVSGKKKNVVFFFFIRIVTWAGLDWVVVALGSCWAALGGLLRCLTAGKPSFSSFSIYCFLFL